MKKTPHFLAVGLIAFSCLTFPQEAKSEPFSIIAGALLLKVIPLVGGLATTYALWLKFKEHSVNKKLKEVDAKVEAGFAEAAAGRMQINSRLDGQRGQLDQVKEGVAALQNGQKKICADNASKHASMLISIEKSGKEVQKNLAEVERRQQESQGKLKEEVRKGFAGLGSQLTIVQGQLAEDQKKWDKVSRGILRIDTRVKSQSKSTEEFRIDIKNLKEGAGQVVEEVSKLHAGQAEMLTLLRAIFDTGKSERTSNPVLAMAQRFMFLPPAYLVMQAYQQTQPFMLSGFTHERHATLFGFEGDHNLRLTITST